MRNSDELASWSAEAERLEKEEQRKKDERDKSQRADGPPSSRPADREDKQDAKDVITIRLNSNGKAEILDAENKVLKTLDEKSTEPWVKDLKNFEKELQTTGLLKPAPSENRVELIHDEKGACKVKVNGEDYKDFKPEQVPNWIKELSSVSDKERQAKLEIDAVAKGLSKGGASVATSAGHDAVSKSSSPMQPTAHGVSHGTGRV